MPESLSSSWTSRRRQELPLMAYSEPPLRNIVRLIVTSEYSIGRAPSALSMVSATSARPSGGRPEVPAKMTSSILPPRSDFAPCSPITQASASTTLDLPDPLGPTMQVIPGSSCRVVADANDLNPRSVRLLRYTAGAPLGVRWRQGRPGIVTRSSDAERRWNDGFCQDTAAGKVSGESVPARPPHLGEPHQARRPERHGPIGRCSTPGCSRPVWSLRGWWFLPSPCWLAAHGGISTLSASQHIRGVGTGPGVR